MPPEPLPWDRKDFFKERKHDRSESVARWRDSSSVSYHHGSSREFTRWGSADFRRPPGHGKQGGWHLFAEDSGHGYHPSRSAEKMLDDESFRQSFPRGDGKYGRTSVRESRGSYSQRDWKVHSWETNSGSPNELGRPLDVNSEQRSVDDMLAYPSHGHSDFANTWDQIHSKDQPDNKTTNANGLRSGLKFERENSVGSMDWKPLKWSRSGSLSSRGSGFSHSSSSKSLGGVDSSEGKAESQQKNVTPVQSPSGDAAACATSAAPSDETMSRKKPRLGWGEGLAKYEKKKVEGPEANTNRGGFTLSASNADPNHSLSSNLADKSPRRLGFSDCASPATPSVACSSSPGIEEKSFGKVANIDNDISDFCGSPSLGSQNHFEGLSFNLEKLDMNSIANLGSSLIELLQSDDPISVDSSFARSSALNKLLVWKSDVSKVLVMTESEIDSLENELKSLKSETGDRCPCPATSSSVLLEETIRPCEEQEAASNLIPRPAPLQIDTCGDAVLETIPSSNGILDETSADVKDEEIDSPGTATSKFTQPPSLVKPFSPSYVVKHGDLDVRSTTMQVISATPGSNDEGTGTFACGDSSMMARMGDDAHVQESVSGERENVLHDVIFCTNKELANRASEVFAKLLPNDQCIVEISGVSNVSCWRNNSLIRERFLMRNRDLKFKERVLTLKYKVFHHLWKEDMRLLSMRKYRAKSQKKCDLSIRAVHGVYQKHRSSIRSRFSSPAGNLSLVPTMEIINFASKLLSDSHLKLCRNALKMPALILDKKEKQVSRFISNNGLVEDPCAVEKERAMINPWSAEERETFMDKLGTFGKDFRKIASFLDHKTTADCVEFYYKNHKSDSLEKTKKKQGKSSSNTYLVTSGNKWTREMNAASLDILGEASALAANAESGMGKRQISSGRILLAGNSDSKALRVDDSITERSSSFDIVGNDKEIVAADVLAGICGSLSSEAMSSCITSSVDPGENYREWKCQKVDSVTKMPLTPDVTQNVDDDTCSDESCGEMMDPANWTDEEKSIFIQAFLSYGKDFAMISRCVRTKSRDQCKVFFSKARKCLGLDVKHSSPQSIGTPMSDDANGGESDMEDACCLESSVGGSEKLGSKVDEDLPNTVVKINEDESDPAGLVTDLNFSEANRGMRLDPKDSGAASDLSRLDDRPEPKSESDGNVEKIKLGSLPAQEGVALRDHVTKLGTSVAVPVSFRVVVDPCSSNLTAGVGPESIVECSTERSGSDFEVQETLLAKSNLDEKDGKSADTSKRMPDSSKAGGESHLAVEASPGSGFSFNNGKYQASVGLDSTEKPSVVLLPKKHSFVPENSLSQDSDALQCEKACNQDRLSSTHDLQESADNRGHKSLSGDDHVPGYPLVNHEPSQVVKGYTLQIMTKKEMDDDLSCGQQSEVKSMPKVDRGVAGPYVAQDCYLQKCNSSKSHSSVAELPFLPQTLEQKSEHAITHSRSLSDTERPSRNGNVKLFGQILNSSSHEDDKGTQFQKQSAKASNFRFAGHHSVDGNSSLLKFDRNNYLGLENVPMRSYAFWDGNRVQTGFPSLPDSAILLAKYPAAFGSYPASSSKMGQQTFVKSNEQSLNGVTIFPSRETSSNGVVDYPVYRSRDGSKVQPFSVDVKQRQEILSEMQRRNGFDAIPSSLQQQGRGIVGMNVVGRGGIVVGGVSDPVAALNLHYAKTEQYGGQSGSIIREDESWRGKGDIGR